MAGVFNGGNSDMEGDVQYILTKGFLERHSFCSEPEIIEANISET